MTSSGPEASSRRGPERRGLTYVAATLTSVLILLYRFGFLGGHNRDE